MTYMTLARVDESILLEAANHPLGLLNEVGYHILVVLDIPALFEDLEHAIERSAHCTFAVLRVKMDGLVAKWHYNLAP